MKTSELTGLALDWAVAKCEGMHVMMSRGGWFVFDADAYSEFRNDYNDSKLQMFRPSTNWAQGGPIIEKEGIRLHRSHTGDWWAGAESEPHKPISGPTPLIAAMRCYVASRLGDEVEVPQELI